MEIQDFSQLLVVGTATSLLINYLKNKFGTETMATKALTLALAVVVGGAYVYLRDTNVWQTIVQVLVVSSAVYALFLRK
jgi:hypothetical protein